MTTATGPAYRALFCDLRTDQVVDSLPLTGVEFDDYIGKAGSLRATVPLPDQAMAQRARTALQPGRTAVWLERGSEIWWGGILWTCTPSGDEQGRMTAEIQAGTFDSYLDHRILNDGLEGKGVDQFDIARSLIDHIQAQPGGDIGIEYGTEVSGVRRTRKYAWTDVARIRELLDSLAALQDGFEWRIHCYRDPVSARRVKRLQLGHPRILTGATDIVLDRPGPLLSYSLPSDATLQANVWVARGESVNRNQARESLPTMSERMEATSDLAEGWPRLEGTSDHSSVTDRNTLNSLAEAGLHRSRSPQLIPEATIRLDGRMTPALIGATVRLRITDLWHPEGLSARYRVVGMTVSPPERAKAETAKLYLEGI
ncbi:hypothetical protein [Streptomyces sp. NPDC046261]|uniref:hypothetical protein n=1 Tax=Streptomyces sp. NPDC046261 TaxID=3157200 RepID=UPI003402A2DF